jgi:hypothetical protein
MGSSRAGGYTIPEVESMALESRFTYFMQSNDAAAQNGSDVFSRFERH